MMDGGEGNGVVVVTVMVTAAVVMLLLIAIVMRMDGHGDYSDECGLRGCTYGRHLLVQHFLVIACRPRLTTSVV